MLTYELLPWTGKEKEKREERRISHSLRPWHVCLWKVRLDIVVVVFITGSCCIAAAAAAAAAAAELQNC
jgi:hypothetical protein